MASSVCTDTKSGCPMKGACSLPGLHMLQPGMSFENMFLSIAKILVLRYSLMPSSNYDSRLVGDALDKLWWFIQAIIFNAT